MDTACRLCLQLSNHMIPIFSENNNSFNLQSQIEHHCCVEISQDDMLPKSICDDCNSNLCLFYNFIQRCKQTQQRLHEFYKVVKIKSVERPKNKKFQSVSVQTNFDGHSPMINLICNNKIDHKLDKQTEPLKVLDLVDKTIDKPLSRLNLYDIDTSFEDCHSEKDENFQEDAKDSVKSRVCSVKIGTRQKFSCDSCKKTFRTKKSLLKHCQLHVSDSFFTCEYCKETFDTETKLKKHSKNHAGDRTFNCEVCKMPFKERNKLACHLRVHGKGRPVDTEKRFLCDMCSKTFVTKSGLKLHLKIHNGLKPFKCKHCGKTFPIFSYKERHERTHAGNKDFVCHVCSASFASPNGLRYHLMSHTGETKFHCKLCGKSFKRRKYLNEHTYTHTGERPFACKICGSTYASSGSLFVHHKKCKSLHHSNSTPANSGN